MIPNAAREHMSGPAQSCSRIVNLLQLGISRLVDAVFPFPGMLAARDGRQ